MNRTFEDLKIGLEKQFIQIHVKNTKDAEVIKMLCKEFKTSNVGQENECYVFGQVFNNNVFGLNASYSPQKNLTIITL